MRMAYTVLSAVVTISLACGGCARSRQRAESPAADDARPSAASSPEVNPTQQAGRGEPTADNPHRAAAWIYIDGNGGEYRKDENGNDLLQWYITTPVSARPNFRVEVHQPLMGKDVDFKCAVQTRDLNAVDPASYALMSKEGRFSAGKDYNLLKPGDELILRIAGSDEILTEAPPLPSGDYVILATVTSRAHGHEVVAASYFTVK